MLCGPYSLPVEPLKSRNGVEQAFTGFKNCALAIASSKLNLFIFMWHKSF